MISQVCYPSNVYGKDRRLKRSSFLHRTVYPTTNHILESSAFYPADDSKEKERHDKMSMKERTITEDQPGEKMTDHEDVLAQAQPFGRMGRPEAIALLLHALSPRMKLAS